MVGGVAIAAGAAAGRESRALTGLRGVGAVLVMLHHFYLHLGLDLHMPMLAGLLRKGYMGVDLFFVLSGFVMAMVYGDWFAPGAPGRPLAYAAFMLRRLARLWPLHALIVLVLVAADLVAGQAVSGRVVAANLALVQAWGISTEINPPAWSISTEVLAYLLFPLLAASVLRSRWGVALGLAATALALAACLLWAQPLGPARRGWLDLYHNNSVLPPLRCLAGFTLGMVAWRLGRAWAVRRWFTNAWAGPGALALLLVLMLGRVNDLMLYPLLPAIVLGLHVGHGPGRAVLARGPIHRLGVLSFAVYLVHVALLYRYPVDWGPVWLVLMTYLAATGAVAVLAHYAVERPGRRLLRAAADRALDRSVPGTPRAPLQRRPDQPI